MNTAVPIFSTITGHDWVRSLTRGRARRVPEAVQARVFRGPACPVCGRPGLHRDLTGGTEIVHGAGVRCWWLVGSVRHPAAQEGRAA